MDLKDFKKILDAIDKKRDDALDSYNQNREVATQLFDELSNELMSWTKEYSQWIEEILTVYEMSQEDKKSMYIKMSSMHKDEQTMLALLAKYLWKSK